MVGRILSKPSQSYSMSKKVVIKRLKKFSSAGSYTSKTRVNRENHTPFFQKAVVKQFVESGNKK